MHDESKYLYHWNHLFDDQRKHMTTEERRAAVKSWRDEHLDGEILDRKNPYDHAASIDYITRWASHKANLPLSHPYFDVWMCAFDEVRSVCSSLTADERQTLLNAIWSIVQYGEGKSPTDDSAPDSYTSARKGLRTCRTA